MFDLLANVISLLTTSRLLSNHRVEHWQKRELINRHRVLKIRGRKMLLIAVEQGKKIVRVRNSR